MAERLSAREVIAEIVRNMHASWEEMYSHILVPSFYQVFLNRSDYERLEPVLSRVVSDAKNALDAELADLNRVRLVDRLVSRRTPRYESADREWRIELFRDPDEDLSPGAVKVTSQLVLPTRQGVSGVSTRFNVTRSDQVDEPPLSSSAVRRHSDDDVLAEFTHRVDGVPVIIPMRKTEFTIGRGGPECRVNLEIANASVSEIHVRIYRGPDGEFCLENFGRYGTTVNGVDVPQGQMAKLGMSATIGMAKNAAVVGFRSLSRA